MLDIMIFCRVNMIVYQALRGCMKSFQISFVGCYWDSFDTHVYQDIIVLLIPSFTSYRIWGIKDGTFSLSNERFKFVCGSLMVIDFFKLVRSTTSLFDERNPAD